MKKILLFLLQTAFLCVIYWIGNQLTVSFAIPIPGNVMGMALLFLLLSAGVVKVEQLEVAGGFLLKHISFFFIPIAVGLMNWGALFYQHPFWLMAAILISAVAALLTVGFTVQLSRGGKKE